MTFLLSGAMVLSLAACGQQNQNDEQPQNRQDNEQPQAADTQALPSQTASVGEKTTEPDVVQTSGGLVQRTDEDGIYRFLGIPYATVKERFVPAGEVEPWDGIYQADSYGLMATDGMGVRFNSKEASAQMTENILTVLGISGDNIEAIQTVSEAELQSAASQALRQTGEELQIPASLGGGYSMDWEPVIDGDFLPTDPVTEDSFAEAGKDIPLLIPR